MSPSTTYCISRSLIHSFRRRHSFPYGISHIFHAFLASDEPTATSNDPALPPVLDQLSLSKGRQDSMDEHQRRYACLTNCNPSHTSL